MRAGVALYRKLVRSPAHVAAALRMMANWRLEPLLHELPRLTTELVLVAAENDRSISPDVARQVREIYPQAIIERLPGLGHLGARRTTAIGRGSHHEIRSAGATAGESCAGDVNKILHRQD